MKTRWLITTSAGTLGFVGVIVACTGDDEVTSAKKSDAGSTSTVDSSAPWPNPTTPDGSDIDPPDDAIAPLPDAGPLPDGSAPWRVFVSGKKYNGDLNKISGADTKCKDLAAAAGLPGTYRAWISTSDDAKDRIPESPGWARSDGTLVFPSKASISAGSLLAAVDRDEKNNVVGADCVWTATKVDGSHHGDRCRNFWGTSFQSNSDGKDGLTGLATSTNKTWTENAETSCNTECRIYCFQVSL